MLLVVDNRAQMMTGQDYAARLIGRPHAQIVRKFE
jgi:hypothetical protein